VSCTDFEDSVIILTELINQYYEASTSLRKKILVDACTAVQLAVRSGQKGHISTHKLDLLETMLETGIVVFKKIIAAKELVSKPVEVEQNDMYKLKKMYRRISTIENCSCITEKTS